MFIHRIQNACRLSLVLIIFSCVGCSVWKPWAKSNHDADAPKVRPDLAESDETLRQPLRPKSEKKRSKWDISNYLDPRTQSIEDSLGL